MPRDAALRRCEERHHNHRCQGQDDAGDALPRRFARNERLNSVIADVDGQQDEADADNPQRSRFGPFSRRFLRVGTETPEQRRSRGHLEGAIETEADERDAAGKESGSQRNQPFQAVVGNGEPLQPDATSNIPGPDGIDTG